MKREILFRGKMVGNDKWHYGLPQYGFDGTMFIRSKEEFDTMEYFTPEEVYPETVGQFTELTDKNGNKIFDGDICNYGTTNLVVEFSNCSFWIGNLLAKFVVDNSNTLKVIGNIHDNPELL